MKIAAEQNFGSIAFPLIGSGSGGFDQEKAKAIMLDELNKCSSELAVKVVVYKRRNQSG
jgi:O-acetyl-ADP-ribose deacetylase